MRHFHPGKLTRKIFFLASFLFIGFHSQAALPPTVTSFDPTSSTASNYITITGTNFTAATTVSFGGTPAQNVIFNSSTTIYAQVSAAGSTGSVSVTTVDGTASLPGFTFIGPPAISSFLPVSSGSGATITLTGIRFTGATAVKFGGLPAASFNIVSDVSITAVVGFGATGDISVTNPYGSGSLAGYTYQGPGITSFSPTSGGQGTTVTITGTGFTGASAVSFGGAAAASFTVVSPTQITAVVGNGSTGNVRVVAPTGTGEKTGFFGIPFISSITPISGPVGTTINITGSNFGSAPLTNAVYVGNILTNVISGTNTSLTVNAPAGTVYQPVRILNNEKASAYSKLPFVSTFTGGPFIPGSFSMSKHLEGANGFALNVVTADLDRDGKPDLITSNADGTVSFYHNTSTAGNTSFAAAADYLTSNFENAPGICAADFDGDGWTDIAIINYALTKVTVLKNIINPDNIFYNIGDFPTGTNPRSICTKDIDGDGKPDLVVTNYNGQSVSVFKNWSGVNIGFAPKVDFVTGVNPTSAVLDDIDNDGKTDMIVLNESGTMSVFRNTGQSGTITFAPKIDIATGATPRAIATGDLDADGKLDIVVSNISDGNVSVYRNTATAGTISFAALQNFNAGNANAIAIGDMDGDGKPDICASSFPDAVIGILKNTSNTGSISFNTKVDFPTNDFPDYNIIPVDINVDGKTDLAFIDSYGVAVKLNKVNELPILNSFAPSVGYTGDTIVITGRNLSDVTAVKVGTTPFASFIVQADDTIFAIAGVGAVGNLYVTNSYGTSSLPNCTIHSVPVITGFTPSSGPIGTTVTITGNGFDATVGDNMVFFGSSRATILTASANSITVTVPADASGKHIVVTSNLTNRSAYSSGIFTTTFPGAEAVLNRNYFDTSSIVLATPGVPYFDIQAGDLDSDGRSDLSFITLIGSQDGTLYTLNNTSSGNNISFGQPQQVYYAPHSLDKIEILDANGDGKPDLVCGNSIPLDAAFVFQNNSSINAISFIQGDTLSVSAPSLFRAFSGDFDGDGRKDVVVESNYSAEVTVFRNTSTANTISYAPGIVIGAGTMTNFGNYVLVEDYNGDGKPDIAFISDTRASVFQNLGTVGNISFAPKQDYFLAGSVFGGAATADIDGDGKIDIVKTLLNGTNKVYVLRNTSTTNISFAAFIEFPLAFAPGTTSTGDVDGDGKPDLCIRSGDSIRIMKNNSIPGTIDLATAVGYYTGNGRGFTIADLDGDGKSDIAVQLANNSIKILRNRIGEPLRTTLCPPMASTTITSNITGASYQWQLNTGSGFVNISDNANYTNTNGITLQLNNIPSSWYGYQYRCVVGATNSYVYTVKFEDSWVGGVSNAWENPANWSCGTVPDANTDVIVNSGTLLISSNVIIRTLLANPNATITVGSGFNFTILH